MANTAVAFFMIHTNRSKEAFENLIGVWSGILVSDNYAIYQKWANLRHNCLAHLIRKAKGLAEMADPELCRCGTWANNELKLLCSWGKDPPSLAEWRTFYARLCRLIALYRDSKSEAGVEPTNNFAERIIRFAVLWRKRSQEANSDKGCRWVERILQLRQTCRLQGRSTFATLVDAFSCYFKEQEPNLTWIRQADQKSVRVYLQSIPIFVHFSFLFQPTFTPIITKTTKPLGRNEYNIPLSVSYELNGVSGSGQL